MNWKKSIIFCVSFLTIFFGEIVVNVACGGEIDPYDYYISYFHNDVQGKDYDQFNFSEWEYLYRDEETVDEYDLNSAEWAKYLNVKKEDVRRVMYESDSATNVNLASLTKKSLKQLSPDLKDNTFIKALAKNKHALKYFAFAKSCEPLATANYDSWNPVVRDTAQMMDKAQQALKLITEVKKDVFLKLRYAYQAARLYHYAENYEACKAVYKQYIEPISSTDLAKGWAMAVYAGSVRYAGDPTEAAYLFSKVFNSNPERRVQAYKNFHYTSAAVADVLAFAQNDEEKAHVIAIKSFGNPNFDLTALRKVYSYIPDNLMNGTLLVREINKLERDFNKPGGFTSNYYDTDTRSNLKNNHLSQLELTKAFALKLADEKKYPEPELGIISAAYLNWLKKDDVAATALLQKLNPSTLKPRYQNQYQIINLLLNARKIKQGTFNANDLVSTLKWLDEKCKAKVTATENDYFASKRENKFLSTTRNFYQELLVPTYMKMGDTTRAALLMLKGDLDIDTVAGVKSFSVGMGWASLEFWRNYLSSSTLGKLEKRFNEKGAGKFDALLNNKLANLNKDDFYELYGTAYLREHQYQKALKCFEKLPANYEFLTPSDWYEDKELYADPFETTINDYPKKYTSAAKKYNKKSFAKEMVRLEKLLSTDKKNAAQHYFKMANGVYQTGYYGNAWSLISYDWSSYAVYEKAKYVFDQDFKLAATAKKWYLKARSLSNDAEFKAKCTFMLAKCEQKSKSSQTLNANNWYDLSYTERDNRIAHVNANNRYFTEMKQQYGQTAYYKKAAYECSYLSDFVVPR